VTDLDTTTTTTIRPPSWCSASDETSRDLPGWQYEAPARRTSLHRERTLHVDHIDAAITVTHAQPYETDPRGARLPFIDVIHELDDRLVDQ